MQSSIRTIYGSILQTAQLLGLPLNIDLNTTLNKKFSIQETTAIGNSDKPIIQYFAIGNGGHRLVSGVDSISKPGPIQHSPRHASLYNQLPFVLKPINSDLSVNERAKYRLRKRETYNGTDYYAYYLKKLPIKTTGNNITPLTTERRTVTNGVTSITPFVVDITNSNGDGTDLDPTIPNEGVGSASDAPSDYLSVKVEVTITLALSEIEALKNVCNIIYADEDYAIISEVALCSGVDKLNVPLEGTGTTGVAGTTYTEAIGVQVNNFLTTFFTASFNNNLIEFTLDLGSAEPLSVST